MHNEIDFGWCDRHPWAVRTFLIVALLLMALVVIRILADSLQPFAQSRVDAAGTSGVYLGAAKMACPQLAFMGYEARVVLGGGEKVYGTACWDLSSGKMIVRPDDQAR